MTSPHSINDTLARSLAYFMEQKGLNQSELAKLSGVSQRSISNYLNPQRRDPTNSGKAPSAKLVEIAMLAAALDVEIWELVREMTPSERDFYRRLEAAYRNLLVNPPTQ